ncbi:MAG: NADH-quinone oxidoreductase subunit K [Spirochaetaceae bacterium]|nr:MAG: NADH-quinone oxidoreductase subunit K [Spirochaetaceae bacterium]
MVYALCFALFVIGLYCALTKKNIVKIVIGLTIMEYAVNLFLVLLGYRKDGAAPIVDRTTNPLEFLARSVDPLPQALVVTSIVIGLGVTTLAIALCVRLYEKYGTFDISEIRRLKG